MKRFLIVLIVLCIPQSAFAASIPPHFVLTGSGFGHGVGMSQIGAEGQALEGQSAQYILNYWFPGTSIVSVPDTQLIRVNIGHQLTSATIALANPSSRGNIDLSANPDGSLDLLGMGTASSVYRFSLVGKKIVASLSNKPSPAISFSGQSSWNIYWTGTTAFPSPAGGLTGPKPEPFTVVKVTTPSGSIQLKYGQVQLKVVGRKIEVTATMTLEQYLFGISEMSSSWPSAALQAQAIASRTYALAHLTTRTVCDCNVYNTMYDQAYIGYAKESEARVGSNWVAAMTATESDPANAQAIFLSGQTNQCLFLLI